MRKKGQAAMEFLMTYGWAILAAVIVIGVLAAFGVFSPESYTPKKIVISAPFGAVDNQVAASASDVRFVMQNGFGSTLTMSNISISGCGSNETSMTITAQEELLVVIPCSTSLTVGEKFNGNLVITYRSQGGQLDQFSTGDLTVEVQ